VDVNAGRGLSVFASWGTSFRAPSLIEVACADPEEPCVLPFALGDDPPIAPVTVSTFEGGARYHTGALALTATAYYSNVKNDIFLFPSEEEIAGSTIQGYFGNIAKTRRVGIELGANYGFGPHSVYANYAYTKATFQSEASIFSILDDSELGIENTVEPGDVIPLVPVAQFKAGLNLRFPFGLRGGFDLRWIGEQYLQQDEANNMAPLPDYFVADLRAGWEVGLWEISGIVTNVFNAKYANFGTFNINQGAPGQPIERFLTPGYAPQFRLIVTRAFGPDRD
jgi:iron complex outermembrane receptor protein